MKHQSKTSDKKILIDDFNDKQKELLPLSLWVMNEAEKKLPHNSESSDFYRSDSSYTIYFHKSISRTLIY